jgi:hypothetical protein
MIKRNDLKDILHRASLNASKTSPDEAWEDMLASLDEHMPVKKKKRRFFWIFFLIGGLSAVTVGILLNSPNNKQSGTVITVLQPISSNSTSGNETASTTTEGKFMSVNHADTHYLTGKTSKLQHLPKEKANDRQGKTLIDKHATFVDKQMQKHKSVPGVHEPIAQPGMISHDIKRLSPYLVLASHTFLNTYMQIGLIDTTLPIEVPKRHMDKKDSVDKPDNGDKNRNIEKRHFAIGGTIGYTFNNFTATENRSSIPFFNSIYQAGKQASLSLYCRIPFSRFYQLQPELGIEPYSTNIQINYKTTGQNVFSRYNLKRMVYAQLGFSNYFEISKNLYITAGAYYAYAMPFYGAQRDMVRQGPGNMEQVMNSSYERTDFRKNVFGLRRNDLGVTGGIEYHIGRISTSIRVSRGFMDVTPETPSIFHNFNINCRLGYHFEFGKKPRNGPSK